MSATRVACPTCGRKVEWTPSATFRPFCSERCKLIDLGAWFSGERAIPDTSSDPEDDEPSSGRDDS